MSIDYTIKAYPTMYQGRRYRSRLEARWAAFFDLLGWKHEYEPGDLGSWSPDFLIRTRQTPILVEVKPITEMDAETGLKMASASRGAAFNGSLLLVGTSPFDSVEQAGEAIAIGWLGSVYHPYPFHDFPIADWFEAKACEADGCLDIDVDGVRSEIIGAWFDAITLASPASVRALWSAATNAVQWRGGDAA